MDVNETPWQHVSKSTFRLKIEGGWLVGTRLKNEEQVDIACSRFFSDPGHVWEL